jgi:hypothetical protein
MVDALTRVEMSQKNPKPQQTTVPEVTKVSGKEINNPDLNPEPILKVQYLRTTNWFTPLK